MFVFYVELFFGFLGREWGILYGNIEDGFLIVEGVIFIFF